jgi:hypothetical protein
MTREERIEYVNNWKKDNDIFLCNALGLEDGLQYKFLMVFFHCTIHIKEASTFFSRSHPGGHGQHELHEIHTIFSVCNLSKWYHVGIRICHVVWQ